MTHVSCLRIVVPAMNTSTLNTSTMLPAEGVKSSCMEGAWEMPTDL